MAIQDLSGREAARARRNAQVYGKAALPAKTGATPPAPAPTPAPAPAKPVARTAAPASAASANSGRNASRARRQAMSVRGKAGVASNDRQRMLADVARGGGRSQERKTDCGCGCNGKGDCGQAATASSGTQLFAAPKASAPQRRPNGATVSPSNAGRLNARARRQAMATMGKNGADALRKGLGSAQLARQQNPEISGRDLARSVRTERSRNGGMSSGRSAPVGRRRPERAANDVTGTKVAHSGKTTGDETGLCRAITGTDYLSSDVFTEFCQTEAPQVPRKVGITETLRGGRVTSGGAVGRSAKVTGDERGSCRTVTGSEYVGREQYDDFCTTKPEPGSAKVSFSQTTRGQIVSGSKPARSGKVTGDEAGTCKAVTGTPYAGLEQYREYCKPEQGQLAEARALHRSGNAGRDITGIQPGLGGLTGAEKGACHVVSGTSYLGATQQQEVCGAMPAQVGEPDFPQPLAGAPWGAFSVVPPSHASQQAAVAGNVTGTRYEQGRISGTFSLGEGKVTGTEQFRFGEGRVKAAAPSENAAVAEAAMPKPRVTGEGLDTGLRITGDDWDRGDRVTGTEGTSAVKRNPTRRGPISAMPAFSPKRNEEVAREDVAVTGSAGSTQKGAPVTVSGGARG